MTKKRIIFLGFLLLAAIVLTAASLPAQENAPDDMRILLEKIRADKKLMVAENMQLTEMEAKSFWPVYERYQDELFLLRERTLKLIVDYADAYEKMNNEVARKLLDQYIDIEAIQLRLHKAYLPMFRKVLSEAKVARYYQIENKIHAALMYELARKIPLAKTD